MRLDVLDELDDVDSVERRALEPFSLRLQESGIGEGRSVGWGADDVMSGY